MLNIKKNKIKIVQALFLLATVAVLLVVGKIFLEQSTEEEIVFQDEFLEKIEIVENVEEAIIKNEQIEKKELFLENQAEKEEKIEELPIANWQWIDNQKKLHELTSAEIDSILKKFSRLFPDETERLKALSALRLGTPYLLGSLGEESGVDKDPIFRLDVADCTTFVLTSVALLCSQTIEEARAMMQFLNYRPPNFEITIENRLHFTTDRNAVSPHFQDITEEIFHGPGLKTVEVVLNKKREDGRRLIDIDWEKEMVFRYIPNQYITKTLFQKLPKAVGVAFVRKNDKEIGLDVRHEGFLFDGRFFFHASSARGEVVVEDFFQYYFREDSASKFDGIILFRIGC